MFQRERERMFQEGVKGRMIDRHLGGNSTSLAAFCSVWNYICSVGPGCRGICIRRWLIHGEPENDKGRPLIWTWCGWKQVTVTIKGLL